jgi:endonuclease/exonuclease/phosphatase family metal-dependent hydrolase
MNFSQVTVASRICTSIISLGILTSAKSPFLRTYALSIWRSIEQRAIILSVHLVQHNAVNRAKILCGDLNLRPDTQSLSLLEEGMCNLIKSYGITSTRTRFYTRKDRYADYVLTSPEVVVKSFQVLDTAVSDHFPLFLVFH